MAKIKTKAPFAAQTHSFLGLRFKMEPTPDYNVGRDGGSIEANDPSWFETRLCRS